MATAPTERLKTLWQFLDKIHLLAWIWGGVVALVGFMQGVPTFWILVGVPLALAGCIVVQMTWFTPEKAIHWPFDWPCWGSIPLPKAAAIALFRLGDTSFAQSSRQLSTQEERLDSMAWRLIHGSKIYGRRPPEPHRAVPEMALMIGEVFGGGHRLHMPGNQNPSYEDLRIDRADLWRAIRILQEAGS